MNVNISVSFSVSKKSKSELMIYVRLIIGYDDTMLMILMID